MIKTLDKKNQKVAQQMQKVFMASYAIEAKLLEADDFPPLKRTLSQYINTDTEFYGFWQGDELAAVIEIRILQSSIHIQSLVVHPDYFRQGIAGQLIDYVLKYHQTPLFTVETGKANHPAIRLYEKYGFKLIKEYLPDHGIRKVCMQRITSISILGCGWLGLPLAQSLIEQGYSIKGTTTTVDKLTKLQQAQISPFVLNLDDLDAFDHSFLNSNILIIAIPTKNIQGFEKLIDLIELSKVQKVLFISSTSVYPSNNSVVDEDTQTLDTPLAQIESLFRDNKAFEATVLRFAGLYGYDRKPGNFVRKATKVKNPEAYVNMIHQDDCIAIIEQIIQQQAWNQTFNACADDHPTRREYYSQESHKLGYPTPLFDEDSNNEYKIICNQKLKDRLNYKYIYSVLLS
jgi:nucleoside-diphosphate-sugar epimerase/GNAT superfamily N-acetyltransferase